MIRTLAGRAKWLDEADLQRLLAALRVDGEEARIAGGAVRDALLGREASDIDIATTTVPDETIRRAAAAGFKCVPTGYEHGTVSILAGRRYEVTTLRADVETDGPFYRQRSLVMIDGVEHEFARQEAHGLGLVWLLSQSDHTYWLLTATTPIDDERVELRLLFLMQQAAGATELSDSAHAAVASTAENVARDVSIWEHKVYRERAPLVVGDGPIGVLRKWARQFYPANR